MEGRELTVAAWSWPFAAETLLVLCCGGAAWWASRWLRRQAGERLAPEASLTARVVGWRLLTPLALPLVWVGLLVALSRGLHRLLPEAGLLELAVPLLWFLTLHQLASTAIALLLPKRHVLRFMTWLAVTLGIILLAVRYFGQDDALMAAVNYPVLTLGPTVISISLILKALFLFWGLFLIAGQFIAFLQNRIVTRTDIDPTLSSAVLRFLKFFLFGIGVLVVLDTAGVNLSALTIFGGALGIGLGFGLQGIANNLVSGIILLMDRSIKQGDVVTVGDSYGWVVRLGARYVVVRTRDGIEKLIPNANLIAAEITNWSHSDRAVRLHVKVHVSYQSDPFKVRDLLLHVADNHPRVLKYPQPNVLLVNFGDSAMEFEIRLWINDPQEGVENVRSAIRFEIWKAFKEHGIEIPFPQRELHITSAPERRPPEFEETMPPSRKSAN